MGKRKFSIEDILKLRRFGDLDVSGRGDVAFTISYSDLDKNKNLSEIHIIRSDGVKAFLVGEGDSSPRWSPDSKLLVFLSRRGAGEKDKGIGVFVWSGVGEPRRIIWFKYGVNDLKWFDSSELVVVTPTPRKGFYDEDEDYIVTDKLPVWFDRRF
ncbi:MAG: hypothetical protein B6U89_06325 [Desulfurococcales archaeon ex4484_58]|nr:MAG: hypothetical protein B6U89_06325 [Desulfurococcales archaeon ex4484_58]